MFERLILFSIGNKTLVGALTVLLVVWGGYSLSKLPFDSTPDITNNQVQVITVSPSLGAQEVEQMITVPVEASLANIPKVLERRSISRSGLSVITLVFEEGVDVYLARQQVGQCLREAEDVVSKEIGSIGLAPVTTGLGEIYHYTLRVGDGYEGVYGLADLRGIQDWIVRKRLAGTEGLADVSGWGGHVKQYEVAVDPDRLNAMGVSLRDVYGALAANNGNTGGSYIERNGMQYFIRGLGLIGTLDEVGSIAVTGVTGAPVLIRDVATVRYGTAMRYGAVTRNGRGEVVAGITLMLKGENFQKVIRNVKERIEDVKRSLPEGIVLEPFIDRSELVGRVTGTVARNLTEGGIIVVLILVLFLGNFRAGMVVASVIPLAMLFAFGMMYVFGVGGNLMSLGAIDFGLIVDGAVIIVEAVCHYVYRRGPTAIGGFGAEDSGGTILSRSQMDGKVFRAASGIRNSAAFGEIIIMIVYLPLFSLGGIEGKMFRPMAMTVFFAILGAFVLSLTYVPMMSALCLQRNTTYKTTLSDRVMEKLYGWYRPIITGCLRRGWSLLCGTVVCFLLSLVLFARLGGEFIPSLEEGDFAAELSMGQGTSLGSMVKISSRAEKILLDSFPEVRQVVTRIGSAEIPT
ncbi:MAG: efflux RND transporter permease subunit, partial [Dysgonamonadaceae bacterium]|nr:efflux RND transporter permease subunit [Dysgonamonadaceae bacterium]